MTDNHQHETEQELNDQLIVRREKMQAMADADVNPFNIGFEKTHLSADLIAEYDAMDKAALEEAEPIIVSVAGRIVSKRGKGKAGFAHIQDMKGRIQLYVRKDGIGEEQYD